MVIAKEVLPPTSVIVVKKWPIITRTILAAAAEEIGIGTPHIEAVVIDAVEEEESLVRDLDRGHVLPEEIITAAAEVVGDGVVVVEVVMIITVIQLHLKAYLLAYPRVFLNQ